MLDASVLVFICACGELTLAGCQLITKLYSAPLHQKDRGRKDDKRLVDRNKERDIISKYYHRQRNLSLGKLI